jgi:hypothetical protein
MPSPTSARSSSKLAVPGSTTRFEVETVGAER